MYPRLTVSSQDDPITEDEDSNSNITEEEDLNSNKSDERAIESLSPMAHQFLKSPVKQGNNSENRPHTPCATPSKSLSKSHPVSFTSTPVKPAEKSGKNTGDKTDRPNLFLRPRAVVSSRDNDDLIALQNQRIEKKAPRVKKCYINSAPNRKEKDENKNLGSVSVSATKTQDQRPSTGKRKEASATRRNAAIIARPT
ncbi:uncharacterized protein LOC144548154 isoform X1 [Carex rostrata]